MRANNNSNVQVCVDNLLKTIKGEVPYSRRKGISKNIVDAAPDMIKIKLIISADTCIETYEPRLNIRNIKVRDVNMNGNLSYTVNTQPKE